MGWKTVGAVPRPDKKCEKNQGKPASHSLTTVFGASLLPTRKVFEERSLGSTFPRLQEWQECTMAAKSGAGKPMSKSEVLNSLAEGTGLSRKQVAGVLDAL